MSSWLYKIVYALYKMSSMLYNIVHALYEMSSMLYNRVHALYEMSSMVCVVRVNFQVGVLRGRPFITNRTRRLRKRELNIHNM